MQDKLPSLQQLQGLLRPLPTIGADIPTFRVSERGKLKPLGRLFVLHRNVYVAEPGNQTFEGLPPEIADMCPQGFLGRTFAHRYSDELRIPPRTQDWSNEHVLISIARRGEDLPGNLILGNESAERWAQLKPQVEKRSNFVHLAQAALLGQAEGSSAGGEQPKFAVYIEGRHCLIKFANSGNTPADRRWRDLLIAESLALEVLRNAKIAAANATIHEISGMIFLEIERFDRIGSMGRRAVLTLAAVDDFLFGNRDTWGAASERLEKKHLISSSDSKKLRLLEAFSCLIADTDRHFFNISFFVENDTLKIKNLKLAPAFDKLPMLFAPVAGQVVKRPFQVPLPSSHTFDVWKDAMSLAKQFWKQVSIHRKISIGFRNIAKTCLSELTKRD